MAKIKQTFFCTSCGYDSPKWEGKCPSCNEWNTFEEGLKSTKKRMSKQAKSVQALKDVDGEQSFRFPTGDEELDLVLGGGIVPGEVILIGGEPGIGKSTLLLQLTISGTNKCLYISGEESPGQVKLRADRLTMLSEENECHISPETDVINIINITKKIKPSLLIVDSIQTIQSSAQDAVPGSVSQIRECTMELQRLAKETGVVIFIIGHITKEGSIAGPKVLEHMVDTVLQFEGERNHNYRLLRCLKNRFGAVDTIGVYDMTATGLERVLNPSGMLLSQREEDISGNAIACIADGQRSMLIETQALVSSAIYGTPQRSATGYDLRRLSMMLAVLEKRCGFFLGQNDVFLNIAGGMKIADPGIDLSICLSIVSSLEDIPIPGSYCFTGEVGLSGEIRSVGKAELRIKEAQKLGFEKMYLSKYGLPKNIQAKYDIAIRPVSQLKEIMEDILG